MSRIRVDQMPHRGARATGIVLLSSRYVLILGIAFTVSGGCGSEQPTEPTQSAPSASRAAGTSSAAQESDPEHPVVRIDTDLGAITLRLDPASAPGTVRNFLNYVSDGFYNDTSFHYVAPGSMILGGGYTVDGRAKPTKFPPIRNEAHNGLKNLRGTVAMARDAAVLDSATSQFFINLADAPQRDHKGDSPEGYGYCVFGEVVDGLEVAERIADSPTQDRGGDLVQSPEPPVAINSMSVVL
jgi:cyclophilin family peptidyl-prolyl cis-trans isomerase